MRKLLFILLVVGISTSSFAQTVPTAKTSTLGGRAADHFMIQLGTNFLTGAPDSIKTYVKGFNRSANVYFMYDKQFKTNPKLSIGIGLGIGTTNIYFNKMEARIGANTAKLPFIRTDTGNNYKKYKIATAFLEIPLELRFMSKPNDPNKSIKGALGVKVGTMINAHTRAKNLQNAAGARFNSYTQKETAKAFFNTTRISLTGRIGYGIYSLFGSYAITNMFKDGVAPEIKTVQIGFCISGL
jgi:hypothetical protein